GESRISARSVPARAARQGAEAGSVAEWRRALPPFESRGLTRAEDRSQIDVRHAHARAWLRLSLREPPGWTVERPDGRHRADPLRARQVSLAPACRRDGFPRDYARAPTFADRGRASRPLRARPARDARQPGCRGNRVAGRGPVVAPGASAAAAADDRFRLVVDVPTEQRRRSLAVSDPRAPPPVGTRQRTGQQRPCD